VVSNPTNQLLVPVIRFAPLSYRPHEEFPMFTQTQPWARQLSYSVDERVKAALRIVETSFWRSNLSAGEIARRLGISSSRLQHLVKKDTGSSLLWHVHASRMRRAALLLQQTRLLVKQVAGEAGYRSTSALERHFKKFFACSPKVYRARKTTSAPGTQDTAQESGGTLAAPQDARQDAAQEATSEETSPFQE
jgi:AraC-like DNA-binding protein